MAQWYIRMRGRTLGPFSWDKMLQLRDSRQLQAFHEVSADNRSWQAAGSIENLFPSKFGAPPTPGASTNWPAPVANDTPDPPPAPPPKKSFPWVWLIVGGVCVMIFMLLGAVGVVAYIRYYRPQAVDDKLANLTTLGIVEFSPRTDPGEIDSALQDVVGLVVTGGEYVRKDGTRAEMSGLYFHDAENKKHMLLPGGTGSCFSVTKDGYLLTNQHVVGEVERLQDSNERKEFEERNKVKITPKVWVFFTREEKYEATIEYISHDYDMAILKIDRKNDRKKPRCLALSNKNPEELPRGTAVMCCGFPAIDRQPTTVREAVNAILAKEVGGRYIEQQLAAKAFDFSLRRGFVNVRAHDYRYMKVDPETNKILEAWPKDALCIQHDAEIFGGNSGGPLLLEDGTVVGINAIKVTGGAEQARLNYAITLPQLRKDIEKIVPGAIWR